MISVPAEAQLTQTGLTLNFDAAQDQNGNLTWESLGTDASRDWTLGSAIMRDTSPILGNPLETTTALHYLVFNGVLERMPKLKIYAVHGGGYLPAYSGRIDHAWGARKDCRGKLKNPPTESLRRVFFDSVVFTHHQLEYLVKLYGADRILMGSDYPFDMADYDPVGHIATSALSDREKALVAGENAVRILGL